MGWELWGWIFNGVAGEDGDFSGDAEMAEPVGAVWSDLEFENGFGRENLRERSSGNGLRRQNQKALRVLGEAEFLRAAHHALALDAAELAWLDFKIAGQDGAGQGERNLVSDLVVFCAADDLAGMLRAVVHLANAESVGVRVLDGFEDFGDDNLVDRNATLEDRSDLKPRATEEGFQIGRRKLAVHKITEPVERDFHGSELFEEAEVVFHEHADVGNAREVHGKALETEAEREAGDFFRIVGAVAAFLANFLKDGGIDHAAASEFHPLPAQRGGPDVDLVAGFGERKKVWAELNLGARSEKLAEEKLQRSLEIGERHALGDIEPLHLGELREVRGIDFVTAIGRSGRDDTNRWRRVFHHADLNTRSVRAQETAVGKIKSILLVAGGMVGRGVQRVETMPLGLNVGSVGNGKSHAAETAHSAVHQLRERMESSWSGKSAGQREVQ